MKKTLLLLALSLFLVLSLSIAYADVIAPELEGNGMVDGVQPLNIEIPEEAKEIIQDNLSSEPIEDAVKIEPETELADPGLTPTDEPVVDNSITDISAIPNEIAEDTTSSSSSLGLIIALVIVIAIVAIVALLQR